MKWNVSRSSTPTDSRSSITLARFVHWISGTVLFNIVGNTDCGTCVCVCVNNSERTGVSSYVCVCVCVRERKKEREKEKEKEERGRKAGGKEEGEGERERRKRVSNIIMRMDISHTIYSTIGIPLHSHSWS